MAVDVRFEPATLVHADELSRNLRPEDAAEVIAATGRELAPVLVDSVEMSTWAIAVFFDDQLACIWGVAPLPDGSVNARVGAVWMLTSPVVERYAKTFWRLCCWAVRLLTEEWDVLVNAIDVRHSKALRWARRLGFRLEAPAPFGAAGLDFCRFVLRKEDLRV